jgi:predicted DNA binding CopG/RHH family protein
MKLPEENPPRLPGETAIYEDDPFALGDIDDSQLVVADDFLPSPQELAARAKRGTKVKVTITLETASVEYFKRIAKEQKVSYQKMIRMLLDEYVQRQKVHDSGSATS